MAEAVLPPTRNFWSGAARRRSREPHYPSSGAVNPRLFATPLHPRTESPIISLPNNRRYRASQCPRQRQVVPRASSRSSRSLSAPAKPVLVLPSVLPSVPRVSSRWISARSVKIKREEEGGARHRNVDIRGICRSLMRGRHTSTSERHCPSESPSGPTEPSTSRSGRLKHHGCCSMRPTSRLERRARGKVPRSQATRLLGRLASSMSMRLQRSSSQSPGCQVCH